MGAIIHPGDLAFFAALASAGSLSAAGRELRITTGGVSRHLASLERRAGVSLVTRSTRRMSLTHEGELLLAHARRILTEIGDLEELLGGAKAAPRGLLRINATLGFGRSHVAPVISAFAALHPDVEVQLRLSVNPPPLTDDAYDVCVRFGAPPDTRVVARRLAANRRLLCAAPAYLAARGVPRSPTELVKHLCIGIRQGEEAYGLWRLSPRAGKKLAAETVKIRGNLTTNDGEVAVRWALDGHGILMRAEWDIAEYLADGRLVQVLPQWDTPDADIYAAYPQHHQKAARVRAFVDFLAESFGARR